MARGAGDNGGGLGKQLRAARVKRGIGLRQLAQQIGMSPSSLSEFENGKSLPGPYRLRALAAALEVPFAEEPNETTPPSFEDWRDFKRLDLPAVHTAALQVFVEVGFHAATIRMIADRCGLSMAGAYYHFDSKDALLTELLQGAMAELIGRCQAADAAAASPRERVSNLVECVILFHTHRQDSAVLASSELRSLDEPGRQRHLQSRRQVRDILQAAVEDCRAPGQAGTVPAGSTAIAIVTMCVAVADWYRPGIDPPPEAIATEYVALAHAMVHAGA